MLESTGPQQETNPEEIVKDLNKKLDGGEVLSPNDLKNYAQIIMELPQAVYEPGSDQSWLRADKYSKEYDIQKNIGNGSSISRLRELAENLLQSRIEELQVSQQIGGIGEDLKERRERHIKSLQNTLSEVSKARGN